MRGPGQSLGVVGDSGIRIIFLREFFHPRSLQLLQNPGDPIAKLMRSTLGNMLEMLFLKMA